MHVQLKNISKAYAGNPVLDAVSLSVDAGQIHALVGENGAGKSTLMKILTGVEQADKGQIFVNGAIRKWQHPMDARHAGIAMVYQELSLIPSLSVYENVFLGRLLRNPFRFVDWAEVRSRTETIFQQLDFPIDMEKRVEELSVAEKQIVEIARALAHHAELIILDEPTSPLTETDADRLLTRIRILKERGVSIVYITHRLTEVFRIADCISILRDGKLVRCCPLTQLDMHDVVRSMVGRELSEQFPPKKKFQDANADRTRLRIEGATRENEFYDVSFEVRSCEILGIAGLVGAGRTELVEAIFGVRKLDQGTIEMDQKPIRIDSPNAAVRLGIGLIPDDRRIKGLVPDAAVHFNLSMATQKKFAKHGGWRSKKNELTAARRLADRLQIKLHSLEQHVSRLSGGNQQKVAIGKLLNTQSSILIFDEPTRGIDVGAKREIYHLIRQLADEGAAVVLVSSELEEILGLSDRILVMHHGRVTGEIMAEEATQENIMQMAVGIQSRSTSEMSR